LIASELISHSLAPLKTSDSGEEALTIMNIYHVKHLPIVNYEMLLGLISEDEIMAKDLGEPIGSYGLSLNNAFVKSSDHLFEVMSRLAEFNLSVIPVVDQEENYLGMITQEDLLQFYANSFSFTEPGGIIVLEMNHIDYSLAEIARIAEAENVTILSAFLTTNPDTTKVYVTIKINQQDIQNLIATFERYDYTIKASFTEDTYLEDLKDRYDALMSYLNV
jgi:predicted transcriptional regulator